MVGWFRRRKEQPEAERAPTLNVTPAAREQLLQVLGAQPEGTSLRILVKDPNAAMPDYDMALEAPGDERPDDTLIAADGVRVLVDAASLASVNGATVDFESDPLRPGFRVEPPSVDRGAEGPLADQVRSVLEDHVNPGIASHGGRADLVAIKDEVVYLALGGGCQGCSMASVTLKQGIEQMIKQMIPRVKAVMDVTDHAQGANPFYTAAKGGESPLHQAAKS